MLPSFCSVVPEQVAAFCVNVMALGGLVMVTVTSTSAMQLPVAVVTRAKRSVMLFRFAVVGVAISVPVVAGSPSYQLTVPTSPSRMVLSFAVKSVEVSLEQIAKGASAGVDKACITKATDSLALQAVFIVLVAATK